MNAKKLFLEFAPQMLREIRGYVPEAVEKSSKLTLAKRLET